MHVYNANGKSRKDFENAVDKSRLALWSGVFSLILSWFPLPQISMMSFSILMAPPPGQAKPSNNTILKQLPGVDFRRSSSQSADNINGSHSLFWLDSYCL